MTLNQSKDNQLILKYAAAYVACVGNRQAEKGVFDTIPPKDYRALQAKLMAVGLGIPARRPLRGAFNGSSADVFFTYLCLGAEKMGINVRTQKGLSSLAPQQ
jgi:hypothetical protein